MRQHRVLLGHAGHGVTELRIFDPSPQVAYADSEAAVIHLSLAMDGRAAGVYIGVQPRPLHLFDHAANRWVPARGGRGGNCARDTDIEYITAVFFDIDVVSPAQDHGHPASEDELEYSLQAARLLSRQDGLSEAAVICCSGNGHYVLAPVVAVPVDGPHLAGQFKNLCQGLAEAVAGQITGVRVDPVYNLSRVMRFMGTLNRKGQAICGRPHRRAGFVTTPAALPSLALHHKILNADAGHVASVEDGFPTGLRCDLNKIERCEFIQWCRRNPQAVSEPQWFGLITNLAPLRGGPARIHEISRLDPHRYDEATTQRVIERILHEGYHPVRCQTLVSPDLIRPGRGLFQCSQITQCPARAPMYLAVSHTIYT